MRGVSLFASFCVLVFDFVNVVFDVAHVVLEDNDLVFYRVQGCEHSGAGFAVFFPVSAVVLHEDSNQAKALVVDGKPHC